MAQLISPSAGLLAKGNLRIKKCPKKWKIERVMILFVLQPEAKISIKQDFQISKSRSVFEIWVQFFCKWAQFLDLSNLYIATSGLTQLLNWFLRGADLAPPPIHRIWPPPPSFFWKIKYACFTKRYKPPHPTESIPNKNKFKIVEEPTIQNVDCD